MLKRKSIQGLQTAILRSMHWYYSSNECLPWQDVSCEVSSYLTSRAAATSFDPVQVRTTAKMKLGTVQLPDNEISLVKLTYPVPNNHYTHTSMSKITLQFFTPLEAWGLRKRQENCQASIQSRLVLANYTVSLPTEDPSHRQRHENRYQVPSAGRCSVQRTRTQRGYS